MKKIIESNTPFIILLFFLCIFYFWGTQFIPYHPDETTQLYMSSDFKLLFTNPSSMFWDEELKEDPRQHYRLLDAPITRYFLGLVLLISGDQTVDVDWDWSKSWEENQKAGAYPNDKLITTARISITTLLPFSILIFYLIGKEVDGKVNGLLTAFLIGTHPVILLSGRRAMAEGALVLGVAFASWTLLKAHEKPWLAGIGMAFVFNAKQSGLALLPVFLISLIWTPKEIEERYPNILKNIMIFSMVFMIFTFLLNPIIWANPFQIIPEAVRARADLLARQVNDIRIIAPDKYLGTPLKRSLILILNLYIAPPEYGLIGNLLPTQKSLMEYINIPGHNLFRGIIWGGIFLVLTVFGGYLALRNFREGSQREQRNRILLLLATFSMAGGLIVSVPIAWIRYSVPMIPFAFLWLSYGLTYFINYRNGSRE
jgi:hypothetical protein